jgi:UDP-N-acetylglucosamine transferase subunit ALG13
MVNNHQQELVDALVEEGAIIGFSGSSQVTPQSMDEAMTKIKQKVVKPLSLPKDNNIFKTILDEGRYE